MYTVSRVVPCDCADHAVVVLVNDTGNRTLRIRTRAEEGHAVALALLGIANSTASAMAVVGALAEMSGTTLGVSLEANDETLVSRLTVTRAGSALGAMTLTPGLALLAATVNDWRIEHVDPTVAGAGAEAGAVP